MMNYIILHPYYTTLIVCGIVLLIWLLVKVRFLGGLLDVIGDIIGAFT